MREGGSWSCVKVRESDNNFLTLLCLVSTATQHKGTQVALQGYPVIQQHIIVKNNHYRAIPAAPTVLYHTVCKHQSPRQTQEMQTIETKSRQSHKILRQLFITVTSPPCLQWSFKSSLTLITPKEREETADAIMWICIFMQWEWWIYIKLWAQFLLIRVPVCCIHAIWAPRTLAPQ